MNDTHTEKWHSLILAEVEVLGDDPVVGGRSRAGRATGPAACGQNNGGARRFSSPNCTVDVGAPYAG